MFLGEKVTGSGEQRNRWELNTTFFWELVVNVYFFIFFRLSSAADPGTCMIPGRANFSKVRSRVKQIAVKPLDGTNHKHLGGRNESEH
jgi:hypothetical protein